ncbi:hypothetical protein COE03_03150 [Bacillus thuringiensis]|nr:hypothetical protein COE03_03150 [Bacillus thuringiensis]
METLHSHCAGLDIHQKEIVVCTYIGLSMETLRFWCKPRMLSNYIQKYDINSERYAKTTLNIRKYILDFE